MLAFYIQVSRHFRAPNWFEFYVAIDNLELAALALQLDEEILRQWITIH